MAFLRAAAEVNDPHKERGSGGFARAPDREDLPVVISMQDNQHEGDQARRPVRVAVLAPAAADLYKLGAEFARIILPIGDLRACTSAPAGVVILY